MKSSGAFVVVSIFLLSLHLHGVEGLMVNVVLPRGMESVNGSSVTMGCTSPLVDSGGVMVCGSRSYLVDSCSPDIDTNTSDWASQLVTVRRNEGTPNISYPHVLLTFGFDTAVSLTGIEMDLFNCSDWNIGAQDIKVFLNSDYNLAATTGLLFSLPFASAGDDSLQSSCDSLPTLTISGGSFLSGSYRTVYILVDLQPPSSIQWVHVGEVRFIGTDSPTCLQPTPSLSASTPFEIVPTSVSSQLESTSVSGEPLPTSVPGDSDMCSEELCGSAVVGVSAVSLLLILTLTTVILTQPCT